MQLLLATRNAHKTREFRQLLGKDFEVTDLGAFPNVALPEETGRTFEDNARLKARAVARALAMTSHGDVPTLVLADDSGLEVDCLGGAPGIFSARYAGENATDKQNIDKLLAALKRIGAADASRRAARFRCVLALASEGKILRTFSGTVEGAIVDLPRGCNGFGYDPVFVPNGSGETFAEMPAHIKNEISHRARAVQALRAAINSGKWT